MKAFIFSIAVFMAVSVSVSSQNAAHILKKVDNTILAVKDKTADATMETTNTNTGKGSIKRAFLMQKGADRKIFRYTYPQSDKGIATLIIPDAVYLYLPMFKKPKKITNMAQSNTFNKSAFSLSDASFLPYSKNFTPTLKETTATDYVLELKPLKDDIEYGKLIIYADKKEYYPNKIVYYNKKNEKEKEAVYSYKKVGNFWVADVVVMTDFNKNSKSTIKMSNIKINQGLKDSDFTVEKLVPAKK
jgi:outer membrane lipoprotein-sorting protein